MRMFLPEANDYAAVSDQSNWGESLAFDARINWHEKLTNLEQTRRSHYLLCAMLGVTYGRGNTVAEIKDYLDRAAKADGTKPTGKIYFVKNSTRRSTPRHDQFARAVELLSEEGVDAEIHTGKTVSGWPYIVGLTSGHSQLNLSESGCRFSPGAIGDNLTSHGARFTGPRSGGNHTCISEFLRLGAAGACGTVAEPTNLPHKFPNASLHVHYARGCSLAEAFYQSVLCPYQQLLVGDPLCQPWASPLSVDVNVSDRSDQRNRQVILTPIAKSASRTRIKEFRLFVDGVLIDRCKEDMHLVIDCEKHSVGSHELRVVAIEDTPLERQGKWLKSIALGAKLKSDVSSYKPD